ncbi:hypothetical protein DV736_g1060, partial [Chaetothyriales sp. CBS 134916]
METLLSHSFDYLSSASPQKVRKGLRQVEGLLAQICLASEASPTTSKRYSMLVLGSGSSSSSSPTPPSKKLADLNQDLAFREFYKLQQSFQWNVAMRLIGCLERLLGKGTNGTNDLLIVQTLDLIQGVLLLHPPSRELFAREIHMTELVAAFDRDRRRETRSINSSSNVAGVPSNTRSTDEKQAMLGRYMSNVQNLVEDLAEASTYFARISYLLAASAKYNLCFFEMIQELTACLIAVLARSLQGLVSAPVPIDSSILLLPVICIIYIEAGGVATISTLAHKVLPFGLFTSAIVEMCGRFLPRLPKLRFQLPTLPPYFYRIHEISKPLWVDLCKRMAGLCICKL